MGAGSALLDVTRLLSRIGSGAALTGIDRVELAYLRHVPQRMQQCFGLFRSPAGLVLIAPEDLARLGDWAEGAALPRGSDWVGRLGRRGRPVLAALEADLRRRALARAPHVWAGMLLRHALPAGTVYLNVGHANLASATLARLRAGAGLPVVVLVHDTIPLDHPEFTRPDQTPAFRRKLAAVSAHADRVIHLAQATRDSTERHMARLGRVPPGVVAPLGITVAKPDRGQLPAGLDLSRPYFVMLGTVEPRKNHAFLLDLWDELARRPGPLPELLILGNRGWADAGTLARLDRGPPGVRLISGLSDGAVAALVAGALALLFPSLAEGFGLPPFEAAALGTPVIASDLPVLRENLKDFPVYAMPSDRYSWLRAISDRILQDDSIISPPWLPTWEDHLGIVLNSL